MGSSGTLIHRDELGDRDLEQRFTVGQPPPVQKRGHDLGYRALARPGRPNLLATPPSTISIGTVARTLAENGRAWAVEDGYEDGSEVPGEVCDDVASLSLGLDAALQSEASCWKRVFLDRRADASGGGHTCASNSLMFSLIESRPTRKRISSSTCEKACGTLKWRRHSRPRSPKAADLPFLENDIFKVQARRHFGGVESLTKLAGRGRSEMLNQKGCAQPEGVVCSRQ